MVGQNLSSASAGLEVKPRYLIYNRLTNQYVVGDISEVKHEIMKYIQIKIEARLEDTVIMIEDMLKDLKREMVGYRDIDTLIRYAEILKSTSDMIAGYIILSRLNSYEELLQSAGEYLAVEEINELLQDEIEMLLNHEEYEKAEILKKCKRDTVRWIGFDRYDEYGSIICEVSE